MPQRHDRLPRLAEAHVVRQDRAAAPEQERDALDLMGKQSIGQRARLPECGVGVVPGYPQQVCECRGL